MLRLTRYFSDRKEKEKLLQKIIITLSIQQAEKDIYIFALTLLDDAEFEVFYEKILKDTGFYIQMPISV